MNDTSELTDRMERLEHRVRHLERATGLAAEAPVQPPRAPAPPEPARREPLSPPHPGPRVPDAAPWAAEPRRTLAPPPAPAAGAAPPRPPQPPVPPRPPRQPRRPDLERWLAANALAIGGAAFVILGAAFFVAVAVSNGWLTPPRQVGLALVAAVGLAATGLHVHRRRGGLGNAAWRRLGEALVGAGGGVAGLAIVAGGRIYDEPLYGPAVGLAGLALVSAFLVAVGLRWKSRVTTALGVGAGLLAPVLVDAPATDGTAAYVAAALAHRAGVFLAVGVVFLVGAYLYVRLARPDGDVGEDEEIAAAA